MTTHSIALDAASKRHYDANGFLHVAASHISKACVNPYYGREIPGWQKFGLDPERLYQGLRDPQELAKAAPTFNGLPLLLRHAVVSPEEPQKEQQVGSVGTDATWAAPYLDNSLIITDGQGIKAVESGTARELSSAYAYEPDFTPGEYEGAPYDFVMRNIRGNHVALVEEGRAGPDVVVADAQINPKPRGVIMTLKQLMMRVRGRILAMDADPEAIEKAETAIEEAALAIQAVESGEAGVSEKEVSQDEDKDAKIKEILALLGPDFDEAALKKIADSLQDLAYSPATGDEDPAQDEEETTMDEEGVKAALDKCGLDADNPEFQKAFAEGVKYGEEKEKSEPKKLDSEHESEGAKKAMDAALRHVKRAPTIAADAAVAHVRGLHQAARDVRPLVGDIVDPMAFDSAEGIYGNALDLAGIDKSKHPRAAWRSLCSVIISQRNGMVAPPAVVIAQDGKLDPITAQLGRIRVEG